MNIHIKKYIRIYIYIYILTTIVVFIAKNIFVLNMQGVLLYDGITAENIVDACFFSVGPAIIGIKIFNKYIWKLSFVKKLFSIKVPYIGGRWEGTLLSTYTQHKKDHEIVIEFEQTLNKINMWYYDENAITHSVISDAIIDDDGGPVKILCIYDNNPIVNSDSGLQRHIGVMELFILSNENKIKGTYFNNPVQKNTYGEIDVKFVSRKRLKIFKPNA
ncbi:MAG: hypothetical protein ACLUH5_02220 [Eubacterium sp.]